jgi:hypothetical protein
MIIPTATQSGRSVGDPPYFDDLVAHESEDHVVLGIVGSPVNPLRGTPVVRGDELAVG